MTWKQWLAAVFFAAALAVVGYVYWQTVTGSALPEGITRTNGRIEAERIDVASKMPGRVAEVMVAEGQWVKADDLVARIDTAELQAELRQAQARVVQAEQQEGQAHALMLQRLSELDLAKVELSRVERLATDGFAAQERLDQRRTMLVTAQAGVAAAEASIALARASIAAAEASVDRLASLIDDATLTAPRSGRVQYILAKPGEVVAAGGRVVTLTDLSDVYMTVFLPARDAGRLPIGAQARIVLDPIPEYVIPATVTFVASTAQFTPKSVETDEERDQLMFRVKLTIAPDLLAAYQDRAKAGIAGIGYVRVDDAVAWPPTLEVKLPQ
ncbi:HlyD family efflux transporter periplasmic adaptor subunit [Aestuariivita sp.]|jgi:HlyD family secretion protein|uniref:HlyD family secretion protein n=1 Tax=Aestuariivita sp. TaxID=1872407 RepID=UPI0025BC7296|nr:HlyD family efflux transporter periplasmic adaptor subunit [Aestuariivita sp.]